MTARSPFDGLRVPGDLICNFFATFSRFEFTLKEMGLLDQRFDYASPDWRKFAASQATRLSVQPGSELESAIAYLDSEPPLIQQRDGTWRHRPLHRGTATERAFDAICRVRNNLFHGGKHTPHSPDGRDEKLVRSALTTLLACVEQDSDLRFVYESTDF